jgi:hypothetical protein
MKFEYKFPKPSAEILGGLPSAMDLKIAEAEATQDFLKLKLLAHEFGIPDDKNMWKNLALDLARILYPEKKIAGRKRKWNELQREILITEVNRLVQSKKSSRGVHFACKELIKKEHWKKFLSGNKDPAEALRKIYFESSKDQLLIRGAHELSNQYSTPRAWEELTHKIVKK